MVDATFWGCVAASALVIAAEVSFRVELGRRLVGLIMAFGVGTLPVMLPLTASGARIGRHLRGRGARSVTGALLLAAGTLTLAAPWLTQVPELHALLGMLGCRSLA